MQSPEDKTFHTQETAWYLLLADFSQRNPGPSEIGRGRDMEAHCAKQPFFQMARQVAGKIEASRAVRLASFAFLPIIHSAMALQHLKHSLCTPGHQIFAESDHRPEPKSTASGAQSPEGEASEGEDWSCWGRRGTAVPAGAAPMAAPAQQPGAGICRGLHQDPRTFKRGNGYQPPCL